MPLLLKKSFLSFFLSFCFIVNLSAQTPSIQNLSQAKVDNLSEAQVKEFVQNYESEGFTIDQVGQAAIQKGMSVAEWNKLRSRIINLNSSSLVQQSQLQTTDNSGTSSLSRTTNDGITFYPITQKSNVFGSSLFSREGLTFEPNLQLPTPENYQLGPGDDVIVDIYGLSENAFKLPVSPEGYIRIPRVGPVQVSGLTIEQARKSIAKQLSTIYTTIQSRETSINVTLGNIRGIKVILIGEVFHPGTYTLPSVASIFNALNAAGGPNDNGSFRNIKLIRNNKVIAKIDIYDFLLTGELKNNQQLRDQDIIKIEPYDKRIALEGEVKNTGLFEAVDGETFSNLIAYAGGFTNNAYKDRVTAFRNTTKEKSVANIAYEDFSSFVLENGDHFMVGKILSRYLNRVQIAGAVFRPGTYALEQGMTVKTLIDKADGVREDAFLTRAVILREQDDRTKEMISFNVEMLLNGKIQDIPLNKEDSIYIASASDMKEGQQVSIWGEIQNEGAYTFRKGMTMKDLIFIAGGVKDRAELREIEVSRLIKDADLLRSSIERTKTFTFSVDRDLQFNEGAGEFMLEAFDQVVARPISGLENAKRVIIDGEIHYPGSYVITTKNERISDMVKRGGGLNQFAYPEGAFLIRAQKASFSERKLDLTIFSGIAQGDTLVDKNKFLSSEGIVGIDLIKILQNPGSKWDLILEEGDIISIPRQLQTVHITGEVFLPVHVRYDKSMSFTDYIDNAGGFSNKAIRRRAFIVYANGMARSTKSFLFFKKYPTVKPGARIFVPTKPERRGMSTGEVVGLATSTTSLAAILISLFK